MEGSICPSRCLNRANSRGSIFNWSCSQTLALLTQTKTVARHTGQNSFQLLVILITWLLFFFHYWANIVSFSLSSLQQTYSAQLLQSGGGDPSIDRLFPQSQMNPGWFHKHTFMFRLSLKRNCCQSNQQNGIWPSHPRYKRNAPVFDCNGGQKDRHACQDLSCCIRMTTGAAPIIVFTRTAKHI